MKIAIAVVLLSGVAAHAEPAPKASLVMGGDDRPWNHGVPLATREAARQVFLEGNRLFRVPLFARAAEQYAVALKTWKHPAFYFNLAVAQLNLGQDVEARDSLVRALQQGAEPLGDEQYREAQNQLAELEHQLGRIRIDCKTQGAEVTLDGAMVFVGPGSYQGWIAPRAHEVTARRQGYLPEAQRVAVGSGELKAVDLELVTLTEATDTNRRWAAWKPWAVVAAGGVVAAAGAGVHALSARSFSDYDKKFQLLPCATGHDGAPAGCSSAQIGASLNKQLDHANREQQIAIGAYIGGGALVAAGVVLLYLNRPRLVEQSPGVAIAPMIAPDLLGLTVEVRR